MGDLDGKTALVTGAASGLGYATVAAFARRDQYRRRLDWHVCRLGDAQHHGCHLRQRN